MSVRKRVRNPEAVEDARRLLAAGGDIELVLVFLRDRGMDQADCIYAIEDLTNTEFHEAKRLVIFSQAWSDRYESDTAFREAAYEALRKLADARLPDIPKIVFEDDDKE